MGGGRRWGGSTMSLFGDELRVVNVGLDGFATAIATVRGATVAHLWKRLADDIPALAPILTSSRAAVDEQFAPMTTPLRDGAVVAVLPPVSGG